MSDMQLETTWYHCYHLQCGHRGKWSQRNKFWESGKEPQLYSTRQPPSNPCPVSYLYFAVFVRWRMPERVRQLPCSMKCFNATCFSKFALIKQDLKWSWNETQVQIKQNSKCKCLNWDRIKVLYTSLRWLLHKNIYRHTESLFQPRRC